ncbi:DUF2059 domain-containing protein [Pontixanthobacter sp. CEM42]|uniref:DUF2059 domain-containing protein n=1 Tax=Pontixanthobacter sp. CEM42 TaxID=2792077 RepID=UPI001ADFB558|nr:DUF2059 domain-containing protein [Pontixanthobacter sp. CEM42]
MLKKFLTVTAASVLVLATPALAQDTMESPQTEEGEAGAEMLEAMMSMFAAEPLTAEQEARLPLATEVVTRMIPEGAMGEMMGSMLDGFLKPILDMEQEPSAANVAEQLGVTEFDISVDDGDVAEALAILDPAWTERKEIERNMMPDIMNQMMTAMEPAMRKGMSEVYAVHFSSTELGEINSFFKTETGANFARKSFTISSDPRLIGSIMESLPEMMGLFETIGKQMEEATAELPAVRTYEDLSEAERARLAELVGMDASGLEATMSGDESAGVSGGLIVEDMSQ